jgi:L-rhamnose isomerase
MVKEKLVQQAYEIARERYAALGVDVDAQKLELRRLIRETLIKQME